MARYDLDAIGMMLESILRSDGLVEWVGGYVYGATSNDDPFIILYPASEHLNEKVCRVYPHDFKKLPAYIPTENVVGVTDANPSRDKAIKKGIYHECPRFKILMNLGKDTQMGREKRFFGVLYAPPSPVQKNGSSGLVGTVELTYEDGSKVDRTQSTEVSAFTAYRQEKGKAPANVAKLREWWKVKSGS